MVRLCLTVLAVCMVPVAMLADTAGAEQWRAQPGIYELDPENVTMTISASRFFMPRIRARFHTVAGGMSVAEAGENTLVLEITAADLTANGPIVEGLLKGERFLNVVEHPLVIFTATGFDVVEGRGSISGNLTMAGRTHSAAFDTRLYDHTLDPETGQLRLSLSAQGTLARSLWGMTSYRGFVGENIRIEIVANFIRQDTDEEVGRPAEVAD